MYKIGDIVRFTALIPNESLRNKNAIIIDIHDVTHPYRYQVRFINNSLEHYGGGVREEWVMLR